MTADTSWIDSLNDTISATAGLVKTYNQSFVPVPSTAAPSVAPLAGGAAPAPALAPPRASSFFGMSTSTILLAVAGVLVGVLVWKKM